MSFRIKPPKTEIEKCVDVTTVPVKILRYFFLIRPFKLFRD
jgi:hypothetical protein